MEPAEHLREQHAAQIITTIQAISDPVERIATIRNIIDRDHALHSDLAQLRTAAVRELLQNHTPDEVAKQLGVTVQRVSQLAKRPSRRT